VGLTGVLAPLSLCIKALGLGFLDAVSITNASLTMDTPPCEPAWPMRQTATLRGENRPITKAGYSQPVVAQH